MPTRSSWSRRSTTTAIPASLKAAIDWHFTQWTAKPVAFVSYGGAAGGRHAVLHLENVLTELHAVTIRDGLAFPNYFDVAGRPSARPERAGYAKTLLDQLAWWANALRSARPAVPYAISTATRTPDQGPVEDSAPPEDFPSPGGPT